MPKDETTKRDTAQQKAKICYLLAKQLLPIWSEFELSMTALRNYANTFEKTLGYKPMVYDLEQAMLQMGVYSKTPMGGLIKQADGAARLRACIEDYEAQNAPQPKSPQPKPAPAAPEAPKGESAADGILKESEPASPVDAGGEPSQKEEFVRKENLRFKTGLNAFFDRYQNKSPKGIGSLKPVESRGVTKSPHAVSKSPPKAPVQAPARNEARTPEPPATREEQSRFQAGVLVQEDRLARFAQNREQARRWSEDYQRENSDLDRNRALMYARLEMLKGKGFCQIPLTSRTKAEIEALYRERFDQELSRHWSQVVMEARWRKLQIPVHQGELPEKTEETAAPAEAPADADLDCPGVLDNIAPEPSAAPKEAPAEAPADADLNCPGVLDNIAPEAVATPDRPEMIEETPAAAETTETPAATETTETTETTEAPAPTEATASVAREDALQWFKSHALEESKPSENPPEITESPEFAPLEEPEAPAGGTAGLESMPAEASGGPDDAVIARFSLLLQEKLSNGLAWDALNQKRLQRAYQSRWNEALPEGFKLGEMGAKLGILWKNQAGQMQLKPLSDEQKRQLRERFQKLVAFTFSVLRDQEKLLRECDVGDPDLLSALLDELDGRGSWWRIPKGQREDEYFQRRGLVLIEQILSRDPHQKLFEIEKLKDLYPVREEDLTAFFKTESFLRAGPGAYVALDRLDWDQDELLRAKAECLNELKTRASFEVEEESWPNTTQMLPPMVKSQREAALAELLLRHGVGDHVFKRVGNSIQFITYYGTRKYTL